MKGSWQRKARWCIYFLLVTLPLFSLAVRFAGNVDYSLRIDPVGYAILDPLEPANEGLTGCEVTSLTFQDGHPENIVAVGPRTAYISVDEGKSWRPLAHEGRSWSQVGVLWRADEPLRLLWMGTLWTSADAGQTWQSWELDPLGPQLDRIAGGELFASESDDQGKTIYYQIDLNSNPPTLGEPLLEVPIEVPTEEGVVVDGNTYQARLFQEGRWAATPIGIYHRTSEEAPWEARNQGIDTPWMVRLSQSPADPDTLAALDSGGRLFVSNDFGAHWKLEPGPSLVSVRYDEQGRLIRTLAERQVFLGDEQVGPPPERARELVEEFVGGASKERLQELLDRFQFQDAGVDRAGRLWVLTCSCSLGAQRQIYGDPFKTPVGEWDMDNYYGVPDYFQLLLQTDQGWELKRGLEVLDVLAVEAPRDLSFEATEGDLFYKKDKLDSAFFFVGLVERAGWVEPGETYFIMGDDGIQVGSVSSRGAGWPATIWSWGYVMNDDSIRYGYLGCGQAAMRKSDGQLQFVIPSSNGVWRGEVPLGPAFHWRAPVYFVAYSWSFWILWLAAIVWLRRRNLETVREEA